jgi:phage host-nuclease inhibitor protein Gam
MAGNNPSSYSSKSEIEEVIQSLQDITREIEKLATEKEKK